jgi:hypothetical protein
MQLNRILPEAVLPEAVLPEAVLPDSCQSSRAEAFLLLTPTSTSLPAASC